MLCTVMCCVQQTSASRLVGVPVGPAGLSNWLLQDPHQNLNVIVDYTRLQQSKKSLNRDMEACAVCSWSKLQEIVHEENETSNYFYGRLFQGVKGYRLDPFTP